MATVGVKGFETVACYLFCDEGGEPSHHCVVPSGLTREETIPMELKDNTWRYSQCRRYVNSSVNNDTTSCDGGWYYDKTEFHSTIVSDVSSSVLKGRCTFEIKVKQNNSSVLFPFYLRLCGRMKYKKPSCR